MKVETFFEKTGRRNSMGKVKGMTAALLLGCVTFALPVSASGTNVQIDAEPIQGGKISAPNCKKATPCNTVFQLKIRILNQWHWGAKWQGLLGAQRVIRK